MFVDQRTVPCSEGVLRRDPSDEPRPNNEPNKHDRVNMGVGSTGVGRVGGGGGEGGMFAGKFPTPHPTCGGCGGEGKEGGLKEGERAGRWIWNRMPGRGGEGEPKHATNLELQDH